jgi:hypothetical protein
MSASPESKNTKFQHLKTLEEIEKIIIVTWIIFE